MTKKDKVQNRVPDAATLRDLSPVECRIEEMREVFPDAFREGLRDAARAGVAAGITGEGAMSERCASCFWREGNRCYYGDPHERPGTVRDSMRSVSEDFFVVAGHGAFELIREI